MSTRPHLSEYRPAADLDPISRSTLEAHVQALSDRVVHLEGRLAQSDDRLLAIEHMGQVVIDLAQHSSQLHAAVQGLLVGLQLTRDDTPMSRRVVASMRADPAYRKAYSAAEPLVSVRIATYDRTEELVEVALASVLAQDYENWEVVVVNDGPNARTRAALSALANPRIRYSELPERLKGPESSRARWQTAGARAMNAAADLCAGAWIAPLDDDDAFTPDHIGRLVTIARDTGAEVAYGAFVQKVLTTGEDKVLFSDPPAYGRFTMQSTLYHQGLREIRYDEESWVTDEPGDWNLARRWIAAGVRFASTPDVVATLNTTPYWQKTQDLSASTGRNEL